jgi:hypothetical protein
MTPTAGVPPPNAERRLWQIAWKSGLEYPTLPRTHHAGEGAARDGVVSCERTSPTVVLV